MLPERLRWRIVNLVDRLPGQCWSDLADWAGRWNAEPGDEPYGLPWAPQSWTCRDGAARIGSCYCGKLQQEPVQAGGAG